MTEGKMTYIVERLREDARGGKAYHELSDEAADEIERLQEALIWCSSSSDFQKDGRKMTCTHDITERDIAISNGMCPICMAEEIEQLRESDKRHHDLWKAAVDGLRNYKAEIKRLRALWAP